LNGTTSLFDRQLRDGRWDTTLGTEDLTSTAIVLIGTSRAGIGPEEIGMDLERTRNAMIERLPQRQYPGGLGIALWACAVTGGSPLAEVLRRSGMALDNVLAFTAPFQTMEVAWLVSGLAHETRRSETADVRRAYEQAVAALKDRFATSTKTFVHATSGAPFTRRIRRSVANFADQIYSIQALAFASLVSNDSQALDIASQSAEHIVELQGELGQWWWHYDARSGRVCQAYPVYSVHQHGMAPMALRTLAAAGGRSFEAAIEKSMAWLNHNEMGVNLIDSSAGTIWRDIEPDEGSVQHTLRHIQSALGQGRPSPNDAVRLKINRETRPYEWAWCLFASALEGTLERSPHLV
jgi:hypothetical protein